MTFSTPGIPGRIESSAVGRLQPVQVMRGLAAMAVVYDHAALFLVIYPDYEVHRSWLASSEPVALLGGIGVDLFFVISGFVMALNASVLQGTRDAGRFLVQRYIRIAPLFYFFSAVVFADKVRAGLPIERESVLNTLTFIPIFDDETYSWPLHYLGWTLAFEFIFYAVVAAMVAAGLGSRPGRILLVVLAMPLFGFVFDANAILWKALGNPILWEFGLGVGACMLWRRGALRRLRRWMVMGLALSIVSLSVEVRLWPDLVAYVSAPAVDGEVTAARTVFWGVPMFFLFCVGVGFERIGSGWAGRLLDLLGDASYSIYLSHLGVVRVMEELVERLAPAPEWLLPDLLVLVTFVGAAVTGIAFYLWLERPLLAFCRRRIGGRPAIGARAMSK